ncbi:Zn(2)-C6 fungal-type domain-containing protein [Favolaschia claudopus]|uniref:Zn(2)-C6 fungal-type domain-containing protein n=1 Tax=Favolaschia claudopus TaxID=2862362 RepID=A0AAW0EH66_9AGAR
MNFEGCPSSADSRSSALRRNQACYHCRHRKQRCDGQCPVCGPCLRASREEDCEYTYNLGRSRAEILEEDIIRIENRIHQLEHPDAGTSSILLHNPYAWPAPNPARMPGLHQILDTMNVEPVLSRPPSAFIKSETTTSDTSLTDTWWNADEPPRHMAETLIDTFLSYRSDWGFFLNPEQFRRDALLPLPLGNHSRPAHALLAAVYLAGILLSPSPALKSHEKAFLDRALAALPSSLSGLHPRKAFHGLQAEIILATYFFSAGKFIEGGYHTAAAVSLALSSGLHETFSAAPNRFLDPGRLGPDEIERFGACWAIFTLDASWALALGTQANLNSALVSCCPLETTDLPTTKMMSPELLLARAVSFWKQANTLVAGKNPDASQNSTEFHSAFNALDEHIDAFRCAVTMLMDEESNPHPYIVCCSIAHSAAIQLHAPLKNNAVSHQKQLDAAKGVLHVAATAHASSQAYINPVIAPVWAAACHVVLEDIRIEEQNGAHDELREVFERGIDAMRRYSITCPITYFHVDRIQDLYRTLVEHIRDAE